MKKSDLINALLERNEDEVLIDIDGTAYDIELGHLDEYFDGFYSVYPAAVLITKKER